MNNKKPTVSIIMNCLNGEKYLREAIDSVYAQTYTDWEIIFWDNASSDNSAKIAKSYDTKLKYFRGDETIPLGAARNRALSKCNGDYIAFLDCDDIWLPEKLERQVPLFNTDVGLTYTLTKNVSKKSPNGNIDVVDIDYLMLNYDVVMSSSMISKRIIYSRKLCFNKRYKQAEEYDLFLRIALFSKVIRINEILTIYRYHKNMNSIKNLEISIIECIEINKQIFSRLPNNIKAKKDFYKKVNGRIAWRKYLILILNKYYKDARKVLRPYIFISFKYFFAYSVHSKLILILWKAHLLIKGKQIFRPIDS